jgi:hypothetical protein
MCKRSHFVEAAVALLILTLALFLRVRHLNTTELWGDQSFTLNTAMRWVNGGEIPLAANKSSAGFVNPPMIEYLYAAALRIWPDVLSVAVLTMISGLVAAAAAGWAAHKVFGKRAALWTTLVFAVNPWSVFYSQLVWNQTMVPVSASLTFACLLVYFAVEQRPLYLILSFFWGACMTQVHPGTGVQLLTMGIVCVVFWRRLRVWPLVVGLAIFVLLYVPFLMYENEVGWTDVKAVLEFTRQPAPLSAAAVLVSLDLLHAQGLLPSAGFVPQADALATALLALSLAYALWAGARAFIQRRSNPETTGKAIGFCILLLWFVMPILLYLRSAHYLQIYYLIGQWPAHFLLIGICLDGVQGIVEQVALRAQRQSVRRTLRVVTWAVLPLPLVALVTWQIAFDVRFQDHRRHSEGGKPQIRHIRETIRTSKHLLSERPGCNLVVISRGHHLETSQLSLLREFVSQEHILLTDGQLAVPLPASCSLYLDALPGSRASTWLTVEATPIASAALDVAGETWQFYELRSSVQANSKTHLAEWTNGVALVEYARGELSPGAALPLTLTWSVEAGPPEVAYHFGTYLLTMGNQVVAQSDGPGFDSIQWRPGDAFITWFDIPVPQELPPGGYQVAVALYSWPGLERVDLTTGGNTAFLEQLRR